NVRLSVEQILKNEFWLEDCNNFTEEPDDLFNYFGGLTAISETFFDVLIAIKAQALNPPNYTPNFDYVTLNEWVARVNNPDDIISALARPEPERVIETALVTVLRDMLEGYLPNLIRESLSKASRIRYLPNIQPKSTNAEDNPAMQTYVYDTLIPMVSLAMCQTGRCAQMVETMAAAFNNAPRHLQDTDSMYRSSFSYDETKVDGPSATDDSEAALAKHDRLLTKLDKQAAKAKNEKFRLVLQKQSHGILIRSLYIALLFEERGEVADQLLVRCAKTTVSDRIASLCRYAKLPRAERGAGSAEFGLRSQLFRIDQHGGVKLALSRNLPVV
ncbi:hypothetical protein IWQ60_011637, partial [Tieghemiomyces parasiticus]